METAPEEYEFDEHEGEQFRELASAMKFVGIGTLIVSVVIGALYIVIARRFVMDSALAFEISGGVQMLCLFVVGLLHVGASAPILRVHTTAGRDITNLMSGLGKLRALYRLLAVVMVLVTLVGVVLPTIGATLAVLRSR